MNLQRGDVVLIDYPFSDRTGSKLRPALVVQADDLNARIDDTIVVAISRSTHRASATQLLIDLGTPEGQPSGLKHNSMVQCENILTVDRQFVIRSIGTLSPSLMDRIADCLKTALGLT